MSSSPQKALIIDDDADLRSTIGQMLVAIGYEVFEAGNGDEGLDVFARERPGLVLTDLLMPGKEGIETIRELRASGKPLIIVAMSGGAGTHVDFLSLAKKFGADATIAKPFRTRDLVALLGGLLTKGR